MEIYVPYKHTNQKKAAVAMLTSDKVKSQKKLYNQGWERHNKMTNNSLWRKKYPKFNFT